NPYSTLTSLGDGKAYHIYMLSSANWQVQGVQIPPNTPISLNDGWNMAAYFPQTQMSTSTAISSISAWLQQVKGSDGVYIPNNPYNTLDFMAPGKGYWIKISGNHSLIYPNRGSQENGLAGIMRRKELPEVALKPGSAVVLARCDIAEVRDILLARVDNELRGAEALIAPESFPAALIQIYCEEAGEQARFSILKPDGQELPLVTSLELEPGQSYGTQSGFIILEPQIVAADDILVFETALKGSYPNPFNPSTTIKYDVAADNTLVSLTIYNIKGQRVCSLVDARIDKGSHTVVWNGTDDMGREVSSGIYLLKFSANNHNRSMKLLLQK
ncbi:MAG: T9SS type A sorting domain-containing protein, partial [Candidatus Cloacimonetes bacterium]|nr:T9SS type A sorting domain-containing protein [Candidatus Cloacimonadota bacterium]